MYKPQLTTLPSSFFNAPITGLHAANATHLKILWVKK
jgi:hypothetical protein